MKKKCIRDAFLFCIKTKTWKIMRLNAFFLLVCFSHTWAISGYSQETKLTLKMSDSKIIEVLDKIEEQSEFYFLFNQRLVDVERKVEINAEEKTIDNILQGLFAGTNVNYLIYDRQIILTTFNKKLLPEQTRTVSGKVTDNNNQPLPGVTIVVKGTTRGTVTNGNGEYSLPNLPEDATLVFSFVGMRIQEIKVGDQTNINVRMEEETFGIEEVVAVGYGTQKKVNITGAVTAVSSEELENRPVTNVSQALEGLVPNLQINTTDGGRPGSSMSWQIRGIGSIGGANDEPLIIIDGVAGNPDNLNPNDIESVSVLKDASASAIYGSRAPYGVVIITTKKGIRDQMKVTVNSNTSFRSPTRMLNPVNTLDFMMLYNESAENLGLSPAFDQDYIDSVQYNIDHPEDYRSYLINPEDPTRWYRAVSPGTDWWGETYKDLALTQNYDINARGGSDVVNYYVSLGYLDQEGLFKVGGDEFKRYSGLTNLHFDATKWLEINMKMQLSRRVTDRPVNISNLQFNAFRIWPNQSLKYPDGNWNNPNASQHYIAEEGGRNKNVTDAFNNTLAWIIKPFDGFKLAGDATYNLGNTLNTENQKVLPHYDRAGEISGYATNQSYFQVSNANSKYYSGNIYLDYTKQLDNHYLHFLTGYQLEYNNYFRVFGYRNDLLSPLVQSLQAATGSDIKANDDQYEWAVQGIFGRINYNFKEKYLFEFNTRYDGTSRFPDEFQWGIFPSFSAGYIVSNESFFEPLESIFSLMKFRTSYGLLGNSNVSNYYHSTMSKKQTQTIGPDGIWLDYVTAPGLGNYNLTWEKPTTFNIAVDIGMLNNHLLTSFDWYHRKTVDMVGPSEPVAAVFGANVPDENNTEMKGTGWEWTLSYRGRINDFNYEARLNLDHHKEVVTKYFNPEGLINSYYDGKVLGEIWGYETVGIINDEETLNLMADQSQLYATWGLGDIQYKDQNNDEKITPGLSTLEDHGDLIRIGNSTPDFAFNISLLCNYKGLDFRAFLTGLGPTDYWPSYGQGASSGSTDDIFFGNSGNYYNHAVLVEHLDRWTPENRDAYYPRVLIAESGHPGSKNKQVQTKYLQNRAYIRLKNIQVGYTLPSEWTQRYLISKARIYVSGEDLMTFTNLKIFDPVTPGLIYPLQKVFSAGFNISF